MKQGTISVLIGCHSPVHSYYVAKAWRQVYGCWPAMWELVCILVHDWGHWGKDYLDDVTAKARHYELGRHIGFRLFGCKGAYMCAGHCSTSGEPQSKLRRPDKESWLLAPQWWLAWCAFVEPALRRPGEGCWEHGRDWKRVVRSYLKENESNPDLPSLHTEYLKRKGLMT